MYGSGLEVMSHVNVPAFTLPVYIPGVHMCKYTHCTYRGDVTIAEDVPILISMRAVKYTVRIHV
jgi:hypothetical protein